MGNGESIVLGIKKPRSGLSLTSDVTPDHKVSGPCSYLYNEWIALSNHHRVFFFFLTRTGFKSFHLYIQLCD